MSEHFSTQVPPHDAGLENALASAVLQGRDVLADVLPLLSNADAFYTSGAREVFAACIEMHRQGSAIDLQLVREYLYRAGRLGYVGGDVGLVDIFNANPSASNARYYATRILDLWLLRRMVAIGTDLSRDAMEMAGGEPREILTRFEQQLFALSEAGLDCEPVTSVQVSHAVLDMMDRYSRGERIGLPLGFLDLDRIYGGLAPKTLTVLAGRPGGGKSKLAGNIATNLASEGKPVMIYSLEMSNEEIGIRLACSLGGVDHYRLTHNLLTTEEHRKLSDACSELGRLPIHWLDKPGLRPMELRASLRRMRRRHGVEVAIIDHMLLMQPDSRHRTRNDEVGEISRMLKLASKEANLAILALCQMNRGVEGRADETPRLSDLRDSGNIEQDADSVMFLHRKQIREGEPRPTTVDVHIAKQRNGPVGKVTLFDRENVYRFENFLPH